MEAICMMEMFMSVITKADIKDAIRNIPDFPIPGIQYKDITPVLLSHDLFTKTIQLMCERHHKQHLTKIAGIEARGFIFAVAMAIELKCGFVPIRKVGKLPGAILRETYQLEYGSKTLEIHQDSIDASDRILIVDDVLATGGTARAAMDLVKQLGARIQGLDFFIELTFLKGRRHFTSYPVNTLIALDT